MTELNLSIFDPNTLFPHRAGIAGLALALSVINPDDVVHQLGADSMRVYEMFMGPFEGSISWSTDSIVGSRRFIERVWRASQNISDTAEMTPELEKVMHQTIKKVGDDIEKFSMNTAIAQMMIFMNAIEKQKEIPRIVIENLITILSPFAPHVCDEIADNIGFKKALFKHSWPNFDPEKLVGDTVKIAVQINGKVRDTVEINPEIEEEELWTDVMERELVKKWTDQKEIKKKIYIKGKIINIVVS